jgi:two-component system sensor histidine kinase RegB
MWFNFLVSAVLIAWFVSRMAEALRTQENAINNQREQQLYDEQILSIATLAAGTAHELGTPINSLSLLVDEMANDVAQSQHQQEDLALMQSQILQCRNSLKKLVHTAQQTQPGEKSSIHVTALVNACIKNWHPFRPEVTVHNLFINRTINAIIHCDESLSQALTNLLNNAANASPDSVAIDIQQHDDLVHIIVSNKGKSIPDNILQQFNRQPLHERRDQNSTGLGFGLFLSNASIHRHGGQLLLRNLKGGGAEAIIQLPLITAEQEAINE